MFGNRGIYHKGWTAVTRHRTPWIMSGQSKPFDDDVWELYDTTKDWSQAHDLSKEMPDKLHELQRLWLMEAMRNNVFPMDDRLAERFNTDLAGRPFLVRGTSQILANGMGGLTENGLIDGKGVGEGRVAATLAMVYSAAETSDVGLQRGSPMVPGMASVGNSFNGTVDVVVIETTGESVDHLLSEEDVLHMIMARQ